MDDIREKIKVYIKTMKIRPPMILDISIEIFEFLRKLNTDDINRNARFVAELFCITLNQLSADDLEKSEIINGIINSFNVIRNMTDVDEDNDELDCSNVMVIMFLKKLNNMVNNEFEFNSLIDSIQEQFDKLSENLENIKVIFRVKLHGKEYFPIGKLLANVIGDEKFNFDVLDMTMINTLLLALEVFDTSEYHDEINKLRKLIEECDIKCLYYLEKRSVLRGGGKSWRLNFKKNGVLILIDITDKKILIRHEDKSYFSKLSEDEKCKVKNEKNRNGKVIASYYEYEYADHGEFMSLEDIILGENNERKEKLLKIIYNDENYNCFYENAFLVNSEMVSLVNPLTSNDKNIVIGEQEDLILLSNAVNATEECMRKYWLELFYDQGLNCVTIGLICKLLTIEVVDISLLCNKLDECSQSQIIENWIFSSKEPFHNLVVIQGSYFDSLNYLKSYNDMKQAKFSDLYLYPVEFNDQIIKKMLIDEYDNEYGIEPLFKDARYLLSFHGTKKGLEIENEQIKLDEIIYIDDEFDNDQKIYTIKTHSGKWLVSNYINKLGRIKKKIKTENRNRNLMPFNKLELFAESQIGYVKTFMELQKNALLDQNNININFNSMLKFRLANNIGLYEINTKDKWQNFLEILGSHEVVKFESIINLVDLDSKGTLYVPKEKQESDSVLTSVINEYLKKNSSRNTDLYFSEIEMKDSKYYLRGNKITEIVILFDTLQMGTSTKRTLDFYFENYALKSYDGNPNRTIKYIHESNQITLKTIMDTNDATLKIAFINATKEGESKVREYLLEKNIEATVVCDTYISEPRNNELHNMCKEIYIEHDIRSCRYPIIREFNQPKKNLFPYDMLDSKKVYSLFVKKKENKM